MTGVFNNKISSKNLAGNKTILCQMSKLNRIEQDQIFSLRFLLTTKNKHFTVQHRNIFCISLCLILEKFLSQILYHNNVI